MGDAIRLVLGLILAAAAVTAFASIGGWWLAPARRTARALRRLLGARPDAAAVSPEQARGVAVSAQKQSVAMVRFSGDPGLVYPVSAIRGVELILDGEVRARVFRGEGRRALDRITPPEQGRVTLRLSLDDDADPDFEVDLWRVGDRIRPRPRPRLRAGPGPRGLRPLRGGGVEAFYGIGKPCCRVLPSMTDQAKRPPDRAATEHEDQKAGSPPRPATEPAGRSGGKTNKTQTDPATGEDHGGAKGSEKI